MSHLSSSFYSASSFHYAGSRELFHEQYLTVCDASSRAPNESNIRRPLNHFQLMGLHPRGIGFSRYLIFCNRTSALRGGPATTHAISIYYRIAIRPSSRARTKEGERERAHALRTAKPDSRVIYYSHLSCRRIDSRA